MNPKIRRAPRGPITPGAARTLAYALLAVVSTGPALAENAAPLARVRLSAAEAQAACHRLMHHDADEFQACLDGLLRRSLGDPARSLGIAYFGWVGAMSSARIALPGAAEAADHFLRVFRPLQRRLGIGDGALCATVPGDCDARVAQVHEREARGGRQRP